MFPDFLSWVLRNVCSVRLGTAPLLQGAPLGVLLPGGHGGHRRKVASPSPPSAAPGFSVSGPAVWSLPRYGSDADLLHAFCPAWARVVQTGPQSSRWSPRGHLLAALHPPPELFFPVLVPSLAESPAHPHNDCGFPSVLPIPALHLVKLLLVAQSLELLYFPGGFTLYH